jgi:hypothetical protein
MGNGHQPQELETADHLISEAEVEWLELVIAPAPLGPKER